MLREVKPICLYLRWTVRAEFGKEFAIYAENSQVTSGVGGTQKKKKNTTQSQQTRPTIRKLQHQSTVFWKWSVLLHKHP